MHVSRQMSRLGCGPGQFVFLSELYGDEGLTQDELSSRVGVDKSNTSRALARLEGYGLIRRESDAGNHRVRRVFLEPKAHEIRERFIEIQNRWNARLLDGLSGEEVATLLSLIRKVADNAGAGRHPMRDERKPSGNGTDRCHAAAGMD